MFCDKSYFIVAYIVGYHIKVTTYGQYQNILSKFLPEKKTSED